MKTINECAAVVKVADKVFAVITREDGEPILEGGAFVRRQFFNDAPLEAEAEEYTARLQIELKDGTVLTTDGDLSILDGGNAVLYPGTHANYVGQQPDQRVIPLTDVKKITAYVGIANLGWMI